MAELLAADREHILRVTGTLWEALRGQRVFLTGGTGFVGTWMVEAFAAANRAHALGAHATLLTRDPARFRLRSPHLASDASIDLLTGDAASFEAPPGAYAYVVHAATERWFEADRARPLAIVERDALATRRVLDFAAARGARRMLFTSSGAVYGPEASALERVPETFLGAPDPTQARAAYGESKRLSEFACTSFARAYGFDAVVARLFAFVGPYLPLDEGYAIGNFIGDVLARRPIAIAGDGTPVRSYLYAADLAVWLWTILLRAAPGRAYNVGSPHAVSIRELANAVAAATAPETAIAVASEPARGAAPSHYVPDTSRAESELGLEPWIDLPEAIRRTHAFHLEHRRTSTVP
ncbi:MAG TPA: NAD-dependent epimerase/dehydratase family protein [Candidatus Acidoferrales bacterium]|nr:NAD-dependent epimerase/dehydratase family protein [Candidatus Acidoferrales bacterium]